MVSLLFTSTPTIAQDEGKEIVGVDGNNIKPLQLCQNQWFNLTLRTIV